MENKIRKIRKLLGNDYHLCTTLSNEGVEWILYRNYLDNKVYFSKDNEPIMSSEKNTIEDLYKYAKDHHKIDGLSLEAKINEILAFLLLAIQIINYGTIKSDYIKGMVIGGDWMIIINCLIKLVYFNINSEKEKNEINEEFKRIIERDEK